MTDKDDAFPIEILLNIFSYLDGKTLITCKKTCKHWNDLIDCYDDIIWPNACHVDFTHSAVNRFWSLQFPKPTTTWQDMYRTTFNWYRGYTKGFYPTTTTDTTKHPCNVIGTPQEHSMFTNLSLSNDERIIRSNPNYGHLLIQSPQTKQTSILAFSSNMPEIVCHYSLPTSPYLVTGAANGTVVVWNLDTKSLVRMWQGHRGRVLCVSMNDEVVVSGGSDCILRVWDIDHPTAEWTNHHRPARRGMIDISSYLSGRSDWFQGVGEIAVNQNLIACAPDASGPILVFSLLTGSLVYELRVDTTHDITAFTRLCLTPFFLLTKGKLSNKDTTYPIIPADHNVILQRNEEQGLEYTVNTDNLPSNMTPYQLAQYYQQQEIPATSACINVWDLQTGKIVYRLLPTLETPHQTYTINDIRVSPDYTKVFACIETRGSLQQLFCWDFGITNKHQQHTQDFDIIKLDEPDTTSRKIGTSWVCYL